MKKVFFTEQVRRCAYNVRIPGTCNFNPGTSVVAHYRMPDTCGIAIKPDDVLRAIICSYCHDAIGGRAKTDIDYTPLRVRHAEGIFALSKSGKRRDF